MSTRSEVRPVLPETRAVPVDDEELGALMEFAVHLAEAAGAEILPYYRGQVGVENKAPGRCYDPVTLADRAAELTIRAIIAENYPRHGVLGEEYGLEAGASRLTWVVDPIDGTKAFMTGLLHWATLVALYDGEKPLLGVVEQPYVGERFVASRLGASWRRPGGEERTLEVRPCPDLNEAVLCATARDIFADETELDAFDRVARETRMVRYGGDCYGYCMLAAGLVDLVIESTLKPHDVQALVPLVEAAGGVITGWSGESAIHGGRVIAAGDRRLHDAAMKLLAV